MLIDSLDSLQRINKSDLPHQQKKARNEDNRILEAEKSGKKRRIESTSVSCYRNNIYHVTRQV